MNNRHVLVRLITIISLIWTVGVSMSVVGLMCMRVVMIQKSDELL